LAQCFAEPAVPEDVPLLHFELHKDPATDNPLVLGPDNVSFQHAKRATSTTGLSLQHVLRSKASEMGKKMSQWLLKGKAPTFRSHPQVWSHPRKGAPHRNHPHFKEEVC